MQNARKARRTGEPRPCMQRDGRCSVVALEPLMKTAHLCPPAIEMQGDAAQAAHVLALLRQVVECGDGENPVDLGLVSRVQANGDEIHVSVIAASPVCAESLLMIDACFHTLAAAMNGSADIFVTADRHTLWSPQRMDDEARQRWHARAGHGGAGGHATPSQPAD